MSKTEINSKIIEIEKEKEKEEKKKEEKKIKKINDTDYTVKKEEDGAPLYSLSQKYARVVSIPLSHIYAEIKNVPLSQKKTTTLSEVYAITSIALSQKYIQLQ